MAGAVRLDGPGTVKMAVLEESLVALQRLHGLVEQMAIAVKNQKPGQVYAMQIRRSATPMVGQLKGAFGTIADQVSAFILVASRGGTGEQQKVRALREQVAMIRQAIEIAQNKVKEQHAIAQAEEPAAE